ncbi:MAG: penicillin-binding protein 1A [Rickettsia endosymbiont of Bryobia graminum]|nr:penicillin-binding protein 1A [Rickettsia endosymbiont of Bryobia graminum]
MFKKLYLFFKLFILLGVIGFSGVIFLFFYYSRDLPDYSQLTNYHPPSVTRIYSRDGKLIEEYALERRVFVPISSIPHSLIEAFIAAEDKNFYEHPGIDIVGIVRAAILNISNIIHHRRVEGASTITQQVVKNFLLTSEVSIERKIKEAILSYRISKGFTKDQILELYLNQTFFGKGAYGVAVAAQNYFNKSIEELTIEESAFIAGLPKAPSNFNPERNYARVKERRDYVIARMLEDGYLTPEAAKEAIDTPIILKKRDPSETVTADYFAEQVREEVIDRLGGKELFYTGGLTIITSLDPKHQQAAESALRKGIRDYDKKRAGYRGKVTNIDVGNWQENLQKVIRPLGMLEYKLAVVLSAIDSQAEIGLEDGSKSKILLADMKWARYNLVSAKSLLKKGDVIVVEKLKNTYALTQVPAVNGGIMVMNPNTGQVLASVGGYDFSASKFDRVSTALRQPGSLSKTFSYIAALENGIKPNKIFDDGPIELSQGPGLPMWRPKNYSGNFLGQITMRTGLEKSRNLITVRVAQAVGISKVADVVHRFGINDQPKKVFSMVLGALESTLEKMTAAYATIANSGKKITPHFVELIKDRNGRIIYRRDDRQCQNCDLRDMDNIDIANIEVPIVSNKHEQVIIDEATNYQAISMLTGAVQRGTATGAKKLGKVIAAKSGTTNDSKDVWFVGFTPKIIVGTYIGYDNPKNMGKTATGSSVAMPIFISFMEKAYADVPSLDFKIPDSIKLIPVDRRTGRITASGDIMEAFKINDLLEEDVHESEGYPGYDKHEGIY